MADNKLQAQRSTATTTVVKQEIPPERHAVIYSLLMNNGHQREKTLSID